ncbi:uncharacterized protein LOC134185982 isoform X2 [Corticium candelabrum]|uniref:uncharacterized protein LOC134185982 isoform X2 n=1 Tax=Corticium candelabrum TaxID=121492 RepID=UPI002E2643D4|nr:uncharacterized protein LOC134185982 isoform X2 [Corticium candelabrum]
MITGSSVHNQRVERFWRDLFEGCTFLFYFLFRNMEIMSLLDPTNETHHQYCRKQKSMQLWIEGMLRGASLDELEDLQEVEDLDQYGIDGNGPVPLDGLQDQTVVVPETISQLSQADLNALQLHVNPLEFSDCHGTDF